MSTAVIRRPRLPSLRMDEVAEHPARKPLAAAASLAIVAGCLMFWVLASQSGPPNLEVRGVDYTDAPAIQAAIGPRLQTSLFSVALDDIERALEGLPWIAHADVSRRFPGTVLARVTEHVVVARWGDAQLISDQGVLFEPPDLGMARHLPVLSGPVESAEEVLGSFVVLEPAFMRIGNPLRGLAIDERGSWTATLSDGVLIRLGRKDIQARARRLVEVVIPALEADWTRVASIDLRYTNGFAVAWQTPATQEEDA